MDRLINDKTLSEHLRLHKLWLEGSAEGVKANLSGADLSGADLSGTELRGANLTRTNLTRANLTRANLTRANLTRANLTGVDLHGVNLTRANLTVANLSLADLTRANLTGVDLHGADLREADLREADLREADLSEVDLTGAYLTRANLIGANLPNFQICPEEDEFIGWKKVAGNLILKLQITGDRTNSLVGRKCRCSSANVLGVYEIGSKTELTDITRVASKYDPNFYYTIGGSVESKYDPDIRVECTKGIHFFITRKEAEEY